MFEVDHPATQEWKRRRLAEAGIAAPGTVTFTPVDFEAGSQRGEPWLTLLAPDAMTAMLERHGFGEVRHISQRDAVDPALWQRTDPLRPLNLSNLVHATVT